MSDQLAESTSTVLNESTSVLNESTPAQQLNKCRNIPHLPTVNVYFHDQLRKIPITMWYVTNRLPIVYNPENTKLLVSKVKQLDTITQTENYESTDEFKAVLRDLLECIKGKFTYRLETYNNSYNGELVDLFLEYLEYHWTTLYNNEGFDFIPFPKATKFFDLYQIFTEREKEWINAIYGDIKPINENEFVLLNKNDNNEDVWENELTLDNIDTIEGDETNPDSFAIQLTDERKTYLTHKKTEYERFLFIYQLCNQTICYHLTDLLNTYITHHMKVLYPEEIAVLYPVDSLKAIEKPKIELD
jgi:hypothetical protein